MLWWDIWARVFVSILSFQSYVIQAIYLTTRQLSPRHFLWFSNMFTHRSFAAQSCSLFPLVPPCPHYSPVVQYSTSQLCWFQPLASYLSILSHLIYTPITRQRSYGALLIGQETYTLPAAVQSSKSSFLYCSACPQRLSGSGLQRLRARSSFYFDF
jgi:hypothetical protein